MDGPSLGNYLASNLEGSTTHMLHSTPAPFHAALALVALAPVAASQTDNCNETGYEQISMPGIQPSSQVLETRPGGSFQVTVKLSPSGVLEIVDANVEGAFTVTIQLPTSCVKSQIEHSGEIQECRGTLEGWNCNPKGAQVSVKYWKAESPCPNPAEGIADFLSSLANFNPAPAHVPSHFPFNAFEDATDELEPGARIRNTARLNTCTSKEDGGAYLPAQGATVDLFESGGSSYARVLGSPAQVAFATLAAATAPVAGSITVTGGGELYAAVHGSRLAGDNLGSLMQSIANQELQTLSVTDAQITVQMTEIREVVGAGSALPTNRIWSGSVSCNIGADARYVLSEIVRGSGGDVAFTVDTVARGGDYYVLDLQAQTGHIHLRSNGGAARAEVTSLRHTLPVRAWLVDPYSIPRGASIGASVDDLGGARTRVVLAPRYVADPSQPGSGVLAALLSQSYEYVIDTSGSAPRVVSLTVRRGQNIVETRRYSRYYQLDGGVWRPAHVAIEELRPDGSPVRVWEIVARGGRSSAVPSVIELPQPSSDRWTIQLD